MKMLVFFLGNCVRTAAKAMVVDRKNQKALALLYLMSGSVGAAAKCCELKRCADRVRRRTDNKDEVLKGQLSILLNLFFPLIKLFLTFVVFGKTRDSVRFRAKNAGYSTGLSQVYATSYW